MLRKLTSLTHNQKLAKFLEGYMGEEKLYFTAYYQLHSHILNNRIMFHQNQYVRKSEMKCFQRTEHGNKLLLGCQLAMDVSGNKLAVSVIGVSCS